MLTLLNSKKACSLFLNVKAIWPAMCTEGCPSCNLWFADFAYDTAFQYCHRREQWSRLGRVLCAAAASAVLEQNEDPIVPSSDRRQKLATMRRESPTASSRNLAPRPRRHCARASVQTQKYFLHRRNRNLKQNCFDSLMLMFKALNEIPCLIILFLNWITVTLEMKLWL